MHILWSPTGSPSRHSTTIHIIVTVVRFTSRRWEIPRAGGGGACSWDSDSGVVRIVDVKTLYTTYSPGLHCLHGVAKAFQGDLWHSLPW